PRLSHRLRPGQRNHGHRGRIDGDLYLLRSLRGLRLRDHHVLRRGARWHGQHSRSILGRPHRRLRSAVLGPDPASPAAERGDLRRLLDDRPPAPARALRALGGVGITLGVCSPLRPNLIPLPVLAFFFSVHGIVVTNRFYQLILPLLPVWAPFGLLWNILSGYGGQLSFGHAAFFGIGAYTVTLAMIYWSLSPWLGIPLGMVIGGLGPPALRPPAFCLPRHSFPPSLVALPLAIPHALRDI